MTSGRRSGVLLVAALVLVATALSVASPAVAAPASTSAAPGCPADATKDVIGTKTVVLLVHGFRSHPGAWDSMLKSFDTTLDKAKTYVPPPFDYKAVNEHWVTDDPIGPRLARYIQCYAQASSAGHGSGKIVLIGHSMGGLAIRCAIDWHPPKHPCVGVTGNEQRVGMVITLGTPNTGSQVQPLSSSDQMTVGSYLSGVCLDQSKRVQANATLKQLCAFVGDPLRAAAYSPAAHAFIPNSQELKDLPKYPTGLTVHGLAGDAQVAVGLFFAPPIGVPDGDLVVGDNSAHDGTTDDPRIGIDCGVWSLVYQPPIPPLVGVGNPLQPGRLTLNQGRCWHIDEPSDPQFIQQVTGLISGYEAGPAPIPTPVPTPTSPPPVPVVDWRNNAYQITCDGLVPSGFGVTLRDGAADVSGADVGSRAYDQFTVTYLQSVTADLTGDGGAESVVLLRCTPQPSNFFVDEVQVFGPADELLAELPSPSTLQEPGTALPPEYDGQNALSISHGDLYAKMLFYAPGDSHASGPSQARTVHWHWDGHQFVQIGAPPRGTTPPTQPPGGTPGPGTTPAGTTPPGTGPGTGLGTVLPPPAGATWLSDALLDSGGDGPSGTVVDPAAPISGKLATHSTSQWVGCDSPAWGDYSLGGHRRLTGWLGFRDFAEPGVAATVHVLVDGQLVTTLNVRLAGTAVDLKLPPGQQLRLEAQMTDPATCGAHEEGYMAWGNGALS